MASRLLAGTGMSRYPASLHIAAAGVLLLAACTESVIGSPSATAVPKENGESSAPASAVARASAAESSAADPLGEAQSCTNEAIGFTVDYPEGWWANERIEPDFAGGTPIEACTYFAPQPVELAPNAGLPSGIAVWFDVETQFQTTGETLSEEEETVDGREALVVETEATREGGFTPEGTLTYVYVVDMADGRQLLAQTTTLYIDQDEYEDAKQILDAMMETLEFVES